MSSIEYERHGEFFAPLYQTGFVAEKLERLGQAMKYGGELHVILDREDDPQPVKLLTNFDAVRSVCNITDDGLRIGITFETTYRRIVGAKLVGLGNSVYLQ